MKVDRHRLPSGADTTSRASDGLWFDLRPLRYVLAAVEHHSFRRAAEMLGTRPSSVSRGVRELEDQLGVALFQRGGAGVRLTDAGGQFLDQVIPALQQIATAARTAGAAGRVEAGRVRVGVITSLAGGFLRRLLSDYSACHPEIAVEVRDGGRCEHLAAVRALQLDIAFFTGNGEAADCETAELWWERVHVALPETHPLVEYDRLDWPMLRDERFIVTSREPGPEVHSYIVRRLADYNTYPQVEHQQCYQDTLMNLVALGQGITPVSAAWAEVDVPGLVLRPLTAPEDIVPFSAVWSAANDNPALRRFISDAYVLAGLPRNSRNRAVKTLRSGSDAGARTPDPSP